MRTDTGSFGWSRAASQSGISSGISWRLGVFARGGCVKFRTHRCFLTLFTLLQTIPFSISYINPPSVTAAAFFMTQALVAKPLCHEDI